MLRQQQTRYFYIDSDRASQILSEFQSYKKHYQEFQFEEPTASADDKTTNALYQEIARGMGHVSKLDIGFVGGGRGVVGRLKTAVKWMLYKVARPVMKISLGQQQEMNRHTILLAQAVVALEARLALLEHQVKTTTSSQSH